MYGFATFESKELMPLPIVLVGKIAIKMDELTGKIPELFDSDGKCQVSIAYDENDNPVKVTTIIVSQQTQPNVDREFYTSFIIEECLKKIIPSWLITGETKVLINPTSEFVKGGALLK